MTVLLETVIARVESADLPYAIRFEDGLYQNPPSWVSGPVKRIMAANVCTAKTALAISCTSYGLFQVLGAVLYGDLAYQNPVSYFHYDAEQQVTQFRALVTKWGFDPEHFDFADASLIDKFSLRYNGPNALPAYANAIKAAYAAIAKEA